MNNIIQKVKKTEYFKYLVAGGLTTIISILSFYLFITIGIDYKVATVLSFLISATFAFFSNKIYVFEHKSSRLSAVFKDFSLFMFSRLFTLAIDFFGMILLVQFVKMTPMVSKILLNIVIFILNYIISKIFIFRKKERDVEEK